MAPILSLEKRFLPGHFIRAFFGVGQPLNWRVCSIEKFPFLRRSRVASETE